MTDRPIIFSSSMVRALLDGRKTMTRRMAWRVSIRPGGPILDGANGQMDIVETHQVHEPSPWLKVQPGDRLWVREAHAIHIGGRNLGEDDAVLYRADYADGDNRGAPWRPSIHMPRWASRLTLTVAAVRVERLQEISEADARAEGMTGIRYQDCDGDPRLDGRIYIDTAWHADPSALRTEDDVASGAPNARFAFRNLWNSLHGPGAWDANPEVVAISFTMERRNIDA